VIGDVAYETIGLGHEGIATRASRRRT